MFGRILVCALLPLSLYAKGTLSPPPPPEQETYPWFTGTLLAFSAEVVPVGYIDVEPYLFVFDTFGEYNQHWHSEEIPRIVTVTPLLFLQIGLTNSIDFSIAPKASINNRQGQNFAGFGDLNMGFDFQLLTQNDLRPAIKLIVQETFPTGKYQKLNPKKKGTDSIGLGSYQTSLGLAIGKLFHLYKIHYLNTRVNFFYNYFTPVHVQGFNTYGGGFGTKGKVRPGSELFALAGFEYNLTRSWALALDMTYSHLNKTPFSGKKGTSLDGTPATVSLPSSETVTLAPALEYNFNESLGIIGGVWFTAGGRNTLQFTSGVIAFNLYGRLGKKSAI